MYGLVTHFVPFKTSGVYAIINTVNGKTYIGSSVDIKKRMGLHMSDLRLNRHHNTHLASSVNKYGIDKFEGVVVELCPSDKLMEKENEWMQRMRATDRNFGYNKRPDATSNAGVKLTEERKKQIGAWSKEFNNRPEMIEKRRADCIRRNSKKRFEDWEKAHGHHPSAKPYAIVSPSGEIFKGMGIKKFSRENGLCYQTMRRVAYSGSVSRNGWRPLVEDVLKCT